MFPFWMGLSSTIVTQLAGILVVFIGWLTVFSGITRN